MPFAVAESDRENGNNARVYRVGMKRKEAVRLRSPGKVPQP